MPASIYNKGHFIEPGSFNYFRIKRIYDQKLELPYNNCYKNVSKSEYHNQTIIDYLIEKKREYTQKELCLVYRDGLTNTDSMYLDFFLNFISKFFILFLFQIRSQDNI